MWAVNQARGAQALAALAAVHRQEDVSKGQDTLQPEEPPASPIYGQHSLRPEPLISRKLKVNILSWHKFSNHPIEVKEELFKLHFKEYTKTFKENRVLSANNRHYIDLNTQYQREIKSLRELVASKEEEIGNLQQDSNHHFHTAQEKTKQLNHLSSLYANLILQREGDSARELELKHEVRLANQAADREGLECARLQLEINSLRQELTTKTTECDFAVRQSRDYAWEIVEKQRRIGGLHQELEDTAWALAQEQVAADQLEEQVVELREQLQQLEGVASSQEGDPEIPPVPGQE